MSQGLALCIGLNSVDPVHYQGWNGILNACENDAKDISKISPGFKSTIILTKEATRDKVINEIKKAAKELKDGDLFMLYYSGHGGQIPDLDRDEPDCLDETWCLYDGEFPDDELYGLLELFEEGVRILVFSDSCHSGTIIKSKDFHRTEKVKLMPHDAAEVVYMANKDFYDGILKSETSKKRKDADIKASILLISGCQDNQFSSDGAFNSLFTWELKKAWNNGKFEGDYRKFHGKIVKEMPSDQTPNYVTLGKSNDQFERQKPFTI